MTLGERLKQQRKKSGLSQEKVAECLGVSRQAVTKWEADQSAPSSENLMALSVLYHLSLDELIANDVKGKRKPNLILRSNLTWLAIAAQATILNLFAQSKYISPEGERSGVWLIILLLLCSLWMSGNLMYEKDIVQRKKNIKIELLYCSIQAIMTVFASYANLQFWGCILIMAVCLLYILKINPQYMHRTFTKKQIDTTQR
ncbi:helix-turn-helix transcriptional regulator [Oscillibacter sp.]|uniref:helix-turn-helix domain-containing protein n=1 Tax=Oscillibacter sp. TaxID=1945593 RepID=UPI0028963659|nr:helix-turn-helix transcriptional regulator [Oscillibacter sp.]